MFESHALASLVVATATGGGAGGGASLQWWQVVAGILAIPGVVLGIPVALNTNRKLRLEQAEIRHRLQGETPLPGHVSQTTAEASEASAGSQVLLMRFVLFFLVLQAWDLVQGLIAPLFSGLASTIFSSQVIHNLPEWARVVVTSSVVNLVSGIGNFFIFFLFGLPLLLDILKSLGLPLREALRPRAVPSVRSVQQQRE